MTSIRIPAWLRSALLATMVPALCSCGDGTITFGGDDDDDDDVTLTVEGNLDDISPVTGRNIVVFVYDLDDDDDDRCPCPSAPPPATTPGKAAVLVSGETEFTLSGIDSGPIAVIFLLDNAGDQADGEINEGDPIAVLDDVDCELDDLAGNLTVTLDDVDIVFEAFDEENPVIDCTVGRPPAAGRARADEITQAVRDD
ncbi:MAG: hypothetical protein ABR587_10780 [Candidatus Binatia bacterium]